MNRVSGELNKLPGLNGLRAIAASFVLFIHTFQIAGHYGDVGAIIFFEKHTPLGKDMVNLFFVISGFIITYILIKEKRQTGKISLWNFYIRRFLRIWPLYFGILILVTLMTQFRNLYPIYHPINKEGYLLIIFFLITVRSVFSRPEFSVLPHYWSLSVEEQFYIFWPPVFTRLPEKAVIKFSLFIVIGMAVARNLFALLHHYYSSDIIYSIYQILSLSMFGSISIGIIGAVAITRNLKLLSVAFMPAVQIISWTIMVLSILFSFYIPYVHFEVMGFVYLVLILNVTSNPKTLVSLENKFLDKTGKISYGIYMYHWLLIPLIAMASKKLGIWDFFVQTGQIPFLIISFLVTYLVAFLSFKYIESLFLKLKPARIKVRDQEKV